MKKIFYLLCICMMSALAFSCSDDDGDDQPSKMIDQVIPQHLRVKIEKYMPIYDGQTPPDISGSYHMRPVHLVYTSDAQTPPKKLNDMDFCFIVNQDNKIDYTMATASSHYERGSNMYLSGVGNKFTAFVATDGKSADIRFKSGIIVSGIYDAENNGISDMKYAMVMISKDNDPKNVLIKEGVFRIFEDEDGWSEYFDWME